MSDGVKIITITDVEFQIALSSAVEKGVEKALSKLSHYSNDEYIDKEEAANLIGVSTVTIDNWRRSKSLKNIKKIGHRYYYSKNELSRGKKWTT